MRGKVIPAMMAGFLSFTIAVQAVTVDGYCYLENQSNHFGSKVLFRADSPTAVTDSVYTDGTGYYQLDVAIGIYDIFYTHEGFGIETVYNQFISLPITLTNVTLSDIPPGVHISGDLSGVLEDTTYIVESDIRVVDNNALAVEAGAVFYFLGDDSNSYGFTVNGSLIALGTEADSIKFMPAGGSPGWAGLIFDNADHGSLEYCVITGCNGYRVLQLLAGSNDSITVRHCTISNNVNAGETIFCHNCIILIEHCNINNNNGYGIFCWVGSRPVIRYCTISGNTSYGIACAGTDEQLNISYCTIKHNGSIGIDMISEAEGTISNCTLYGNGDAGISVTSNHNVAIINTIIEGNTGSGIYFHGAENTTVTYCDVYNNTGGNFSGNSIPQALGEVVTVNANGDSCDVYANIYMDPMFVDPFVGDYHLQSGSPCIDAGDPASPLDPDGTIADMGAFYYDQSTWVKEPPEIAHPSEYRLLSAYPNPFNPATTILFEVPNMGKVRVNVYDVLGREVATLVDGDVSIGRHTVVWDAEVMPAGIYFVQMATGEFRQVRKVVLLK